MKWFNYSEFDSPDEPGSGFNMSRDFLKMLDECRELAGIPFVVTSGFRTKAHQEHLMSRGYATSKTSAHMMGMAADIRCENSADRYRILTAALAVGFNRVGIAHSFIHLDNADHTNEKTTQVVWLYD